MRTATTETIQLLRDVIASFTHHPDKLEVLTEEFSWGANFELQTVREDHPKLVGNRGAHIRALTVLVDALYDESEYSYDLKKLREPVNGKRLKFMETTIAAAYDPTTAALLLEKLLRRILLGKLRVQVDPRGRSLEHENRLFYTLSVLPAEHEDFTYMIDGRAGPSVISCLDTIWRAYGAKDGVAFCVEARER